ncbi:MAG TPA: hypothetical protein VFN87_08630 [Solirubrobacteraceae bacterium]|nr:hypothetical protein [Solirubrobacteraceae bacterium]
MRSAVALAFVVLVAIPLGGAVAAGPVIHTGVARAARLRPMLDGDGIGGVMFGQSPAAVARRLGRLFGAPVGAQQVADGYRHAFCGFDWEAWEGLGANSDGRPFVAELDVWFRHGRFVGYDFGANNSQTKLSTWDRYGDHRMELSTARGLAVGDPIGRARHLYGRALTLRSQAQGTPPNPRLPRLPVWEVSLPGGRITGAIGTVEVQAGSPGTSNASSRHQAIGGIGAGTAPNTPCSA